MHKVYEVMLRQYPLVHANDGRDALQKLGEHDDIDLVLLDINMPNMNGLEFLAALSDEPAQDSPTVIVISTEGKEEDTRKGLEAGAVAYIKKPFRSEEILEIIAKTEASPVA
jgi:two-component system chemotaxis response regulator CheY